MAKAKLNVGDLAKKMIEAMKGVLTNQWKVAKDYAEMEGKKLAQTLVNITKWRVANTITDEDAKGLLQMQANASKAVLLALAGIGLIAAQRAIQAALDVVKGAVNTAIGIPLI